MKLKNNPNLTFKHYDLDEEYFSKETDSPFSIKSEEIKRLDKERPLGLSGHLRAKNEVFSVGEAIESSIPALDELIITIQPYINDSGIDETYEICKQKAAKYPDKIRLFYYTPDTNSTPSSHIKSNIDIDDNRSIHSFAHYHNFGLKEIRYKYYMKIDGDQIYWTSKLKELKNAMINADKYTKNKRTIVNKIIGRLLNPFHNILSYNLSIKHYIAFITMINKKCSFGLSGIQLTLRGGAVY